MSILKSIAKGMTKVAKSATRIAASPNPLATAAAGLAKGGRSALPAVRMLPGIGTAVAVGSMVDWEQPGRKKRVRRKGISGKDLSSFKRVARLIDKYAAPVHKLRKSSYKPHAN